MAYSTLEDLKKLTDEVSIIRMADDTGNAPGIHDTAVSDVIAEATEQADSEIDGYLSGRYRTPLEPVPVIISALSARMTMYYLSMRRKAGTEPRWETLYNRAVEMLVQISKGVVSIGAAELEAGDTAVVSGGISVSTPPRVFTGSFLDRM